MSAATAITPKVWERANLLRGVRITMEKQEAIIPIRGTDLARAIGLIDIMHEETLPAITAQIGSFKTTLDAETEARQKWEANWQKRFGKFWPVFALGVVWGATGVVQFLLWLVRLVLGHWGELTSFAKHLVGG